MKFKLNNIPPLPAVLLAIISVQSGAAIAKSLFPSIGATGTASLRIGIAALILLIAYRPNFKALTAPQWKAVIPYGICLGAMNLIFYFSIERIPIGLAVTLEFIGPLALALFGSKRIIDFLWITLAGAGIVLIAPFSGKGVDITGMLLAILAGIFWAGYIILGGKISKIMDSGKAVATGMLFASILVVPFGLFSDHFSNITPSLFGIGIALALLSSAIPFTLEMKALKTIPAKTFSILMSLEPAFAALCALLFLEERLLFHEALAVLFVITASAGATLTSKK